MQREAVLIDQIAHSLRQAGFRFDRDVALSGLQPDFVVHAPDGRRIVVEIKTWEKSPGFRSRAAHQADLYQRTVGVDQALLVVHGLDRSRASEGVVTADKLVPALKDLMQKKVRPSEKGRGALAPPKRYVFAAMPFDPKYDDVFFVAMVHAADALRAVCKRVDKEEFSSDIVEEIQALVRGSVAVIVDLSESKPNVLYEAGYSHALGKPVVHICSTPLGELPFDVAHWNTIAYRMGQTYQLRDPLTKRLRAALKLRSREGASA